MFLIVAAGCRPTEQASPAPKEQEAHSSLKQSETSPVGGTGQATLDCAAKQIPCLKMLRFSFDENMNQASVEGTDDVDEKHFKPLDPACYNATDLSSISALKDLTHIEFNKLNPGARTEALKKQLITQYIETASNDVIRFCYQRKQADETNPEGEEKKISTDDKIQIRCDTTPRNSESLFSPTGMIDYRPIERATSASILYLHLGEGDGAAVTYAGKLHQLTDLYIEFNNRSMDVSSLTALTNIEHIHLAANPCGTPSDKMVQVDISFISALKKLKSLYLTCVNVENLQAVSGLSELEEIHITELKSTTRGDAVVDLSPFKNLTKVQNLIIKKSNVVDISGLGNMTKMKELRIIDSPVSDISALSGMTSLVKLELGKAKVKDLTPLRNLRSLDVLDLADNPVEDLTPIENLTKLTVLKITNTKVETLMPLRKLKKLYYLDAEYTRVTDISVIRYLPKIHQLHLFGTRLKSLRPLRNTSFLRLFLGYFDPKDAPILKTIYADDMIGINEKEFDYYQLRDLKEQLDAIGLGSLLKM
jgi:hypothetical protein